MSLRPQLVNQRELNGPSYKTVLKTGQPHDCPIIGYPHGWHDKENPLLNNMMDLIGDIHHSMFMRNSYERYTEDYVACLCMDLESEVTRQIKHLKRSINAHLEILKDGYTQPTVNHLLTDLQTYVAQEIEDARILAPITSLKLKMVRSKPSKNELQVVICKIAEAKTKISIDKDLLLREIQSITTKTEILEMVIQHTTPFVTVFQLELLLQKLFQRLEDFSSMKRYLNV